VPQKIDTQVDYLLGIGGVEIPAGATVEVYARSEFAFAPRYFMIAPHLAPGLLILDIKIEGGSQLISPLFRGSSETPASVFTCSEPVRLNFDTVLEGQVVSVVVQNSLKESCHFSGAFSGPKLQRSATLYHLVRTACKNLFAKG
jgi:hypothetical protein